MKQTLLLVLAGGVGGICCLSPLPATAAPATYVYDQTSSSVPQFTVTASLVVNGDLGDIPSISNTNPGPYDFGNLLSFNVALPGANVSLSDFTSKNLFGFPIWSITQGGGFFFLDKTDSFDFNIGNGPIHYNTDNQNTGCGFTGLCTGAGHWVAVPEPVTLSLFGSGVIGAFAKRELANDSRSL
jgi:hypothetical protein